ncbi:phosphocholine cytidylyltransferase family protein [Rhizobium sp. 1AS11]|uniref:phosphocholine cytidylyltransferase family protein n=1 Tax=Rhizobium acaciae TaxID=2989736 RepID=UPI00222279D0|nr:phosphocholine cytidylyltransferase family protein [Rhizobium acaciae]MCW1413001.1 phosphocholine cytidylyltransferase family protein [Rhizobium acaciae]MCW1745153.1 phosphocholine cytidylyltransferase family protein [Rhizobium acaciae]
MTQVTGAVILAAGLGSRLRPHTNLVPKPLVKVLGTPILHNTLHQLSEHGVSEATIVVGYRQEVIREACGRRFENVDISYVANPIFDRTGSAYSLWMARDTLLCGDTVFIEGDVFFDGEVLGRTLQNQGRSLADQNVAAVASFATAMSGSAVELDADGFVSTFVMNQTPQAARALGLFKTINITAFSVATSRAHLMPALQCAVDAGDTKAYVEQIQAGLLDRGELRLSTVDCSDIRWFEIDTEADLRIAENLFSNGRSNRKACDRGELPGGLR